MVTTVGNEARSLVERLAGLSEQERAWVLAGFTSEEVWQLDAAVERIATEEAERSLRHFVQQAWSVVEPATPFVPGWHIDCIADHLEAVARGQIRNLLINVPPRHAKPVDVEALVLMGDGSRKRLGDIVVGDRVIGASGRPCRVSAVHEQGLLECLELVTFNGRSVRAAPEHPFLTPEGWVQAKDLRIGQALACVPAPCTAPGSYAPLHNNADEAFELAGYFVGDGCTAPSGGNGDFFATITSGEVAYQEDVVRCAERLGFVAKVRPNKNGVAAIHLSAGVRPWLRAIGLAGLRSATKRVPSFVFQGTPRQIGLFLAAYFHCDGTLSKKSPTRKNFCISFSSISVELLKDVQHLALRLGVSTRLRRRTLNTSKWVPAGYQYWNLDITHEDEAKKFLATVPIRGRKLQRLQEHAPLRTRFASPFVADPLVAVAPVGLLRCRCLTVEEDASFTANDLLVHNSLCTAVFWPAWVWCTHPEKRWLCASYAEALSVRDNVKCRRLLESPWYRARWPQVRITTDQNTKQRYDNTRQGYRIATGVGGGNTGEGGDFLLADDPHKVKEAESDAERENVLTWWAETMATRGNDPKTFARVVVMQRIHGRDLSGALLEQGNYHHLCLPARWEPRILVPGASTGTATDHETSGPTVPPDPTDLSLPQQPQPHDACPIAVDPRTTDGELLWPERFGEAELRALEHDLVSSYAIAGQLQQRPVPREGALFKAETIQPLPEPRQPLRAVVQFYDLAFSAKDTADYVAGVTLGITAPPPEDHYLLHAWRERIDEQRLDLVLADQIANRSPDLVGIEIGAFRQQATQDLIVRLQRLLARRGCTTAIIGVTVSTDKVFRAQLPAARARAGLLYADKRAPWYPAFEAELLHFPKGAHDDYVDALSGAVALAITHQAASHRPQENLPILERTTRQASRRVRYGPSSFLKTHRARRSQALAAAIGTSTTNGTSIAPPPPPAPS